MARGVKDLRDLICVSRLSCRDSDDGSDDDLSRPLSSMSLYGEVASNFNPSNDVAISLRPRPPSTAAKGGAKPRTTQGVFKRPSARPQTPSSFDFRKFKAPLPPVCNISPGSRESSRPSTASSTSSSDRPSSGDSISPVIQDGNYDPVLAHMDSSYVNEWLTRSNVMVSDLTTWCNQDDNYVRFAHFWLMEFPEYQRLDLIKMEVDILSDEMTIAFANGIRKGHVRPAELNSLVLAVLREYPARLCTAQGPHVFLNILDTLSSEKTHDYKRLLTDVKINTRNRNYAQWMLALRAFLLLNVWSNVVSFYRKFKSEVLEEPCADINPNETEPKPNYQQPEDAINARAFQAVRLGYVSVLYYLIKSGQVHATVRDEQGRTLVFSAVMLDQQRILHYLVTKVIGLDMNRPCRESGNTPLHAAANLGYVEMVTLLLMKGEADPNVTNPKCDQATPLHLAVMQGHYEICEVLLKAGADASASMNGITPVDLAQDLGQTEIHELLRQSNNNYIDETGDKADDQQMDES